MSFYCLSNKMEIYINVDCKLFKSIFLNLPFERATDNTIWMDYCSVWCVCVSNSLIGGTNFGQLATALYTYSMLYSYVVACATANWLKRIAFLFGIWQAAAKYMDSSCLWWILSAQVINLFYLQNEHMHILMCCRRQPTINNQLCANR